MVKIDRTKPVLVTGANGYVASWLVKLLLEKGITVHAAVRNPLDQKKVLPLTQAATGAKGTLKLFKADLLTKNSYKEAMEGCELVFHTASPFILKVSDPQKELIDPALKGTQNVLETVNQVSSVKRVILTSSVVAMCTDAIDTVNAPGGKLTEAVWNTTASLTYQPYCYSKTLAEKKAWEIAGQQSRWDLVVVNPSMVLGPALNAQNATSESLNILKMLGGGQMRNGAPNIGVGVVDVRDLAEAHYIAGYNPDANGRYIVSGHNTNFLELAKVLQPKFGSRFPLPKRALPKWLLMIIGPLANDPLFTRQVIRNNVNVPWNADNSKIKKELGIAFRPLSETIVDTFQNMVDEQILVPKGKS